MFISVPALGEVLVSVGASGKAPARPSSASGVLTASLEQISRVHCAEEETQPKGEAKGSEVCDRCGHLEELSPALVVPLTAMLMRHLRHVLVLALGVGVRDGGPEKVSSRARGDTQFLAPSSVLSPWGSREVW